MAGTVLGVLWRLFHSLVTTALRPTPCSPLLQVRNPRSGWERLVPPGKVLSLLWTVEGLLENMVCAERGVACLRVPGNGAEVTEVLCRRGPRELAGGSLLPSFSWLPRGQRATRGQTEACV